MKPTRVRRVAAINASIAVAVAAAAVAGYVVLRGPGTQATSSQTRTATAQIADVTATVSASGTSEPSATSQVSFQPSGTIATIKVAVGAVVAKGQVLATLETAGLQTAVDVARARDDAAQAQYAAAVEAYDGAVAAQDTSAATGSGSAAGQGTQSVASASASLSTARANRLQASNDLDAARLAVSGATLRSPRAGTVLAINGTVAGSTGGSSGAASTGSGASAGSGSASGLFTIADLTQMQVSASFAEADAMSLKVGQPTTTVFNAAATTPVAGKVTSVAPTPTTSNSVVSYAVTVSLANLPKGLRSGQSATVTVTTGSKVGVLSVPASAVRTIASTHQVTVVSGSSRTSTTVQVGLEGDQLVEITDGLTAGQQVLLTATSTSSSNGLPSGGFPGGGLGANLRRGGQGAGEAP